MPQVNVPCFVRFQDGQTHSALIIDMYFIQQNVVNEGANQPANEQGVGPGGYLLNNQATITPDQVLGEIEVLADGAPFLASSATWTVYVTPPGGVRTGHSLYADGYNVVLDMAATKAIFPTPGTYLLQVEAVSHGITYEGNIVTIVLNQVPLT